MTNFETAKLVEFYTEDRGGNDGKYMAVKGVWKLTSRNRCLM